MISHKYKCIFVHIPKVAGQSIERVFLKLHDLTWETRGSLLLCENNDPKKGPPRLAHLKASEYVKYGYLTQEKYDSYFKFAFVRNPWARLISMYKYLGYAERLSFKNFLFGEFIKEEWNKNNWFVGPQSDYIFDDEGNQIVDYVGRFESLQEEFNSVCERAKLPSVELPHVNRAANKNNTHKEKLKKIIKIISPFHRLVEQYDLYTEYYDKESENFVADLYANDIKAFNYRFGD